MSDRQQQHLQLLAQWYARRHVRRLPAAHGLQHCTCTVSVTLPPGLCCVPVRVTVSFCFRYRQTGATDVYATVPRYTRRWLVLQCMGWVEADEEGGCSLWCLASHDNPPTPNTSPQVGRIQGDELRQGIVDVPVGEDIA